jgi:hypothetical protein
MQIYYSLQPILPFPNTDISGSERVLALDGKGYGWEYNINIDICIIEISILAGWLRHTVQVARWTDLESKHCIYTDRATHLVLTTQQQSALTTFLASRRARSEGSFFYLNSRPENDLIILVYAANMFNWTWWLLQAARNSTDSYSTHKSRREMEDGGNIPVARLNLLERRWLRVCRNGFCTKTVYELRLICEQFTNWGWYVPWEGLGHVVTKKDGSGKDPRVVVATGGAFQRDLCYLAFLRVLLVSLLL